MDEKIKPILINRKVTIRRAMEVINEAPRKNAPAGIVLIVNKHNKLLGVVTDGDIRRAILKGVSLDLPVEKIMTKDPVTVRADLSNRDMLEMVLRKVRGIPRLHDYKVDKVVVVDEKDRVENVISFFELWKGAEIRARNICIVGLGYIGLTLGLILAEVGFRIIGVDTNRNIIKGLSKRKAQFYEPGLVPLLKFHLNKNFFVAPEISNRDNDVYIICVGTPINSRNKKPSLRQIRDASQRVAKFLKKGDLVIVRSTVPVGTSRNIILPILEKSSGLAGGKDFYLAFAPERTIEGKALEELRTLPQIVGGLDKKSVELTSNLLSLIAPNIITVESLEAAEMVKLVNNAFRDLSFGFANELALTCDKFGLEATKIINAANEGYPRDKIPVPSPGVGGYCLKKDPYIFMDVAKTIGSQAKLSEFARKINEYMPLFVAKNLIQFCKKENKNLSKIKIFVIGFAFKGQPETSDTRGSCSIDLVKYLKKFAKNIYGYDPVVSKDEIKKFGVVACSLTQGFKNADCVLIMNNHQSYQSLDIYSLVQTMRKPGYFFDGWHIFSSEIITKVKGITYKGL